MFNSTERHPAFEEYCECIFELHEDDLEVIQAHGHKVSNHNETLCFVMFITYSQLFDHFALLSRYFASFEDHPMGYFVMQ